MAKSVKGIIADSTKAALLEEQKQELIEKVQKDPLTGLYNKSATQNRLPALFAQEILTALPHFS